MDADLAISTHQLTKTYRIWHDPARRLVSPVLTAAGRWMPGALQQRLQLRASAGYRDFHALQDVTFDVRRGEAVGILGRNGAGKSTLLQLIAGTLQPTAGSVQINGRVAALLELGAGFNPDFTGRENVFLSGAVLGLSRSEMEARYDQVAAFADIGDFIEQPVKTYSSGMQMRLAFAVNTCVDPDILIVDEALGVGDAPFQAKCFRRLRQLIEQGVTLLFVSHDIGTVRSICSRALWLKHGRSEAWGEAKEVAKMYERYCWQEQGVVLETQDFGGSDISAKLAPIAEPTEQDSPSELIPPALLLPNPTFVANRHATRIGTGTVVIDNFVITKADGTPASICEYNESLDFHFLGHACRDVDSEFVISIRLRDLQGNHIISAHDIYNTHHLKARSGDQFMAKFTLNLPLHHQKYVVAAGIFGFQGGESRPAGAYDFGLADLWDVIEDAAFLQVRTCSIMPLPGPVHVTSPLHFQTISPG